MAIGLLERRATTVPVLTVAGPVVCALVLCAGALWALGAATAAGAAGVMAFAIGAATAGSDSRSRGDWTATPPR